MLKSLLLALVTLPLIACGSNEGTSSSAAAAGNGSGKADDGNQQTCSLDAGACKPGFECDPTSLLCVAKPKPTFSSARCYAPATDSLWTVSLADSVGHVKHVKGGETKDLATTHGFQWDGDDSGHQFDFGDGSGRMVIQLPQPELNLFTLGFVEQDGARQSVYCRGGQNTSNDFVCHNVEDGIVFSIRMEAGEKKYASISTTFEEDGGGWSFETRNPNATATWERVEDDRSKHYLFTFGRPAENQSYSIDIYWVNDEFRFGKSKYYVESDIVCSKERDRGF